MQGNVNYQKQLDAVIARLNGHRAHLLLHCCCAPCSSYVLEYLTKYFRITLLFYNPNIAPEEEYRRREAELRRLVREMLPDSDVDFAPAEYRAQEFYDAVRGLEQEPEGGRRCEACFRLRLAAAARAARAVGADYFTTTLTISPLKNAGTINTIGGELAPLYGTAFLPSDFKKREGYKRSIQLSREYALYRQDYCGCVFSKTERERQKQERDLHNTK